MAKQRTLEELAIALNQVEKESVFPTTQMDLYGKLLDEVQYGAPMVEDNMPLSMAYEALEKYARNRIKALLIDFADYHGVAL
jgi:hypothetical protein